MEYVKPFGQYIQFDNNDIIVTSWHDLPLNPTEEEINRCVENLNGRYCTNLGDSAADCTTRGGKFCDYLIWGIKVNSPRTPEE